MCPSEESCLGVVKRHYLLATDNSNPLLSAESRVISFEIAWKLCFAYDFSCLMQQSNVSTPKYYICFILIEN